MPAGVGPLVAVEDPLEVLGGLQRVDGRAVGDREQRHLGAVEVLLDHDPLARRPRGRARLVAVVGDDHALAGGEAVVLHDVRRAERVEGGRRLARRSCTAAPQRSGRRPPPSRPWRTPWTPRAGRPPPTARSRRSRARGPRRPPRPRAAPRGRRPRGRRRACGELGDRLARHGVDVVQRGDRGHPRVAGGRVHLGDARVAGQGRGRARARGRRCRSRGFSRGAILRRRAAGLRLAQARRDTETE